MNSEKELFKQAYMNLRSRDRIPFPDDVFDEFLRLRQGYKLVPVEPTDKMIEAGKDFHGYVECEGNVYNIYKAMIGGCDD